MLRGKYCYVRSASVALTAAFGMTACSLTDTPLSQKPADPEIRLDITRIRNAQGATSVIATAYNEEFDNFKKRKIRQYGHEFRDSYDDDGYLWMLVENQLSKGGFGFFDSAHFTRKILTAYNPQTYKEGNRAPMYRTGILGSEIGPTAIRENDHAGVSKNCAVVYFSKAHSGEAWVRSWLDLDRDTRKIKLPAEYKQEFIKMIEGHEAGHCMGGDEAQADAVAAKMLLKFHPDKKKALEFLELFMAMRVADNIAKKGEKPEYHGTVLALDKVMTDFKNMGGVPESVEEIWSQALERNPAYSEAVLRIVEIAKHETITINQRDHAALARYMSDLSTKSGKEIDRHTAILMSKSFSLLAKFVEPPPLAVQCKKPFKPPMLIELPVKPC